MTQTRGHYQERLGWLVVGWRNQLIRNRLIDTDFELATPSKSYSQSNDWQLAQEEFGGSGNGKNK